MLKLLALKDSVMDYTYEVAKEIHEDRLRRAETRHTLQQIEERRAGLQATVLNQLGDLLITAGSKLKQQPQRRQPELKLT
jgi:hypothetical protein